MSLLLAVVAIVVGIFLVRRYPNEARDVLMYLLAIRRVVFGVLLLVAAVVLLGTGNFIYMLAGFAIIVLATVYVLCEEPHKEMKSWLTS